MYCKNTFSLLSNVYGKKYILRQILKQINVAFIHIIGKTKQNTRMDNEMFFHYLPSRKNSFLSGQKGLLPAFPRLQF